MNDHGVPEKLVLVLESAEAWLGKYDQGEKGQWHLINMGPGGCPLCKEYWPNNCRGCPINDRTLAEDCRLTPYTEAREAYKRVMRSICVEEDLVAQELFWEKAGAEYTFLVELALYLYQLFKSEEL